MRLRDIHIDCVRSPVDGKNIPKTLLWKPSHSQYSLHRRQSYLAPVHWTHNAVRFKVSFSDSQGHGSLVPMASEYRWQHVIWIPVCMDPPPFVRKDLRSRTCLHEYSSLYQTLQRLLTLDTIFDLSFLNLEKNGSTRKIWICHRHYSSAVPSGWLCRRCGYWAHICI